MSSALLLVGLLLLRAAGFPIAQRRFEIKLRAPWYALAPCWALFVSAAPRVSRRTRSILSLWEAFWTYGVLFAIVLAIQSTAGVPTGTSYLRVIEVVSDSAADGVLEPGDVLIDIGGKDVATFRDGSPMPSVSSYLQSPVPAEIGVRRGGDYHKLIVTPRLQDDDSGAYLLGVMLEIAPPERSVHFDPLRALALPVRVLESALDVALEIVRGHEEEELSGPVGVVVSPSWRPDWRQSLYRSLEFLSLLCISLVIVSLLLAAWIWFFGSTSSTTQSSSGGRR